MKKNKKITYHGLFCDSINYDALIEMQANTPTFLDSPREYVSKAKKNYGNKKLVLSYKKVDSKNKKK